jgi:hypothetical protein
MKYLAPILISAFLAMTAAAGAQSAIPDNPDSLFDQPPADQPAAVTAPPAAAPALARGIEIGGYLYSDYTGFLKWTGAYPDLGDPAAGVSSRFVPDLEADLYFDARPFDDVRVFTKLKAAYPFTAPGISVFEAYADLNWNDRIYLRAGQQVVNWGVGYFFSPADIISLTPINPLQPDRERQGPLALRLNAPFADVDNLYLYVVANQAFAESGGFRLDDLAIAPKVEVLLGGWEVGVGAYYQKDQDPKAMVTATGSLFSQLGVFAEGVLDDTLVFSGTAGTRWLQADWHISATVQYYYNGEGYTGQFQGSSPAAPLSGKHYLAGQVSWTDILASKVDLALFTEANLGDGSVVMSPSVAFTPFRSFTITFAPYVSFGPDDTELVTQFGRLSLSMKIAAGTGSF